MGLLRSWWLWFALAWGICILGVVCATSRGFDTHPFGDFAGKFLVGATLVSWLGLTAVVSDPLRSAIQRVLARRSGSIVVAVALAAIGVSLLCWSHARMAVQLACRPDNLTVWLDGERLDKPCTTKIWTSPAATLLAYADGFQHVGQRIDQLPTDHGARVLLLTEIPRWSCSLHGGNADDGELFAACGKSAQHAPWTRSRTWGLNLVLRANARVRMLRPTLWIEARQGGTAVAIQSTGDECFARADEHKVSERDAIPLSGCGHDGDYSVNVTVCTAGGLPITANAAHWITFHVQENDDEQSYECAPSGTGALDHGGAQQ